MRIWQLLCRWTVVAAFVVTVFALAASVAEAHAGHHHHAGLEVQTTSPMAPDAASSGVHIVLANAQAVPRPTIGDTLPGQCAGGCCSAGMSCCGAWITTVPEIRAPHWLALKRMPVVLGGVGIAPHLPLKPPRSISG